MGNALAGQLTQRQEVPRVQVAQRHDAQTRSYHGSPLAHITVTASAMTGWEKVRYDLFTWRMVRALTQPPPLPAPAPATIIPTVCPITPGRVAMTLSPKLVPVIALRVAAAAIELAVRRRNFFLLPDFARRMSESANDSVSDISWG